jgi:hypothetical protein
MGGAQVWALADELAVRAVPPSVGAPIPAVRRRAGFVRAMDHDETTHILRARARCLFEIGLTVLSATALAVAVPPVGAAAGRGLVVLITIGI